MNSEIPFIFAIIPTIFLVRYFYLKDINKPEPIGLIIKMLAKEKTLMRLNKALNYGK